MTDAPRTVADTPRCPHCGRPPGTSGQPCPMCRPTPSDRERLDDSRTVADVWHSRHTKDRRVIEHAMMMPFDQFCRRLAMGERAETTWKRGGSEDRDDWQYGWNACLDHIRGDP